MAEELPAAAIEIDRGPFRKALRFHSADDAIDFLNREDEIWTWTKNETLPHGTPKDLAGRYHGFTDAFRPLAEAWKNFSDPAALEKLRDRLKDRYVAHQFLACDDATARSLLELAQQSPPAAAVALAVMHGHVFDQKFLRQEAFRVGVSKAHTILAGVDTEKLPALVGAYKNAETTLDDKTAELRKLIVEISAEGTKTISTVLADASTQAERLQTNYNEKQEEWQKSFVELKGNMEGTTAAYDTHMSLEGPVRYWRGKSRTHRKAAHFGRWALIVFSVIALVFLYLVFDIASGYLQPLPGKEVTYTALFKTAAFSIVVTTIIFWIGRVLVRNYLSDRHLATDAEEQMTMIMTFLALLKKQAVTEKDRELIMGALFRPGSDGIVKDEAAPDTALATLLATLMKR